MVRRPGGYVYFIQGPDNGLIKIGFTWDSPFKRLRDIQAMCPVPLVALGAIAAPRWFEKRMHKRFASVNAYGEWFHPGDRLVYLIKRWAKPFGSVWSEPTTVDAAMDEVREWAKVWVPGSVNYPAAFMAELSCMRPKHRVYALEAYAKERGHYCVSDDIYNPPD